MTSGAEKKDRQVPAVVGLVASTLMSRKALVDTKPSVISRAMLDSIQPRILSQAMLDSIQPRILHGRAMRSIFDERVTSLQLGFMQTAGTVTDIIGRLQEVISMDGELENALSRSVESTQARGAFGFDYRNVRSKALEVSLLLERKPELERKLAAPLEAVRDVTSLDDEQLLDLGDLLGWWDRIRSHQVSTAGLILGFTAGLTRFVAGGSVGPAPIDIFESIVAGGSVYLYMSSRRTAGA